MIQSNKYQYYFIGDYFFDKDGKPLIPLSSKGITSDKVKKDTKQSVKRRASSESKLLDKFSNFASSTAEIKKKEHELQVWRLEQQMKMDERKFALKEKQM